MRIYTPKRVLPTVISSCNIGGFSSAVPGLFRAFTHLYPDISFYAITNNCTYKHANPHSYSNQHADTRSDSYTHKYANTDPYTTTNGYSNPNPDFYTYSDSDTVAC